MQFLIAAIVAIGAGFWIYGKFMRTSGNNTKSSLIVTSIISFGIFVVIFMLALAFLPG